MELSRLYDRQRSGGLWAALSGAGLTAIAFFNFVILSRLIGPEGFGLMALVNACLALALVVLRNAAAEALIQVERPEDGSADTMFWTLLAGGLAAVAVVAAVRGAVEGWFGYAELPDLLLATSVVLPLTALSSTSRGLLARELRFDRIGRTELGSELVGGVTSLALALGGLGVWSLVWGQVAARTLECAGLCRAAGWTPRPRWSARRLLALSRFSAPQAAVIGLTYLERQAPRFFLGAMFGAAEVGYYFFAVRVTAVTEKLLIGPVRWLAMPTFAKLRAQPDELRAYYQGGVSLTATLLFPFFVGVALAADQVVPLALGPDWEPAVLPLQILALASLRLVFVTWNRSLVRGLGKQSWMLVQSVCRTATALALMVWWLERGAAGVAAAILAAAVVSWPLGAWFVTRLSGMKREQLRPALPAAASAAVMAAALLLARPALAMLPAAPACLLLIAGGVAVYFGALAAIGPAELRRLVEIARDAWSRRPGALRRAASLQGSGRAP